MKRTDQTAAMKKEVLDFFKEQGVELQFVNIPKKKSAAQKMADAINKTFGKGGKP